MFFRRRLSPGVLMLGHIMATLRSMYGTSKGAERNVHLRKAGQGRMPQHRGNPKDPAKRHRRKGFRLACGANR